MGSEMCIRDSDQTSGLASRLADPLWLLHRQREVGEFAAEDGGYPMVAELRGVTARIDDFRPLGSTVASPYDPDVQSLEVSAEAEMVFSDEVTGGAAPFPRGQGRVAVEAGLQFARLAKAAGNSSLAASYLSAHPLREADFSDLSPESARLRTLAVGRAINGYQLLVHLRDVKVSLSGLEQKYVDWCEGLFEEPELAHDTWAPKRLEHQFEVGASLEDGEGKNRVTLTADEYHGGRLDWYHFDAAVEADNSAPHSQPVTWQALPSPATYAGMPASRYWEYEDERVRFGDIKASETGLATALLIEFAITYGNDWFVIPIDLNVGSVTKIQELVVTDSFGEETKISPVVENDRKSANGEALPWSMFSWGAESSDADGYFFLAPSLSTSDSSEAVEKVSLVRDEMANVVFAIEETIQSAASAPHSLQVDHEKRMAEGAAANPGWAAHEARLVYRLQGYVPEHWHPLTPKVSNGITSLELQSIHRPAGPSEPRGKVLLDEGSEPFTVHFEEVPEGGIQIVRDYQLARWTDGRYRLWTGKRKRPGRHPVASGLRYDSLEYSGNTNSRPPEVAPSKPVDPFDQLTAIKEDLAPGVETTKAVTAGRPPAAKPVGPVNKQTTKKRGTTHG